MDDFFKVPSLFANLYVLNVFFFLYCTDIYFIIKTKILKGK